MTISNDRSVLNVMIDDPTDKKIPVNKTFVVIGVFNGGAKAGQCGGVKAGQLHGCGAELEMAPIGAISDLLFAL